MIATTLPARLLTGNELGLIVDQLAVAGMVLDVIRKRPDGHHLRARLDDCWAVVDVRGTLSVGVGDTQLVGVPFCEMLVDLAVDRLRATN